MFKRRAFTLVELLVVVAIIALLIAILLPSLNKAREAAKSSICLGNLHQSGVAMLLYASDYHGKIVIKGLRQPGWVGYGWTSFVNGSMDDAVYLTNLNAARCPKMGGKGSYAAVSAEATATSTSGDPAVDWVGWPIPPLTSTSFTGLWTVVLAKITKLPSYALLMDSANQDGVGGPLKKIPPQHGGASCVHPNMFWTGGQTIGLWMAHPRNINGLLADGHTQSFNEETVKTLSNPNSSVSTKTGVANWWDEKGDIVNIDW